MKHIILALILGLFSFKTFAQDIELTPEGFKSVVLNIEGKTAQEIYKKSLNFVQEYYKNPDKVLKANIENEKIRIEGYGEYVFYLKILGKRYYSTWYTIEIEFKDNKARFTFSANKFTPDDAVSVYLSDFYKKDGSLKNLYKTAKLDLEKFTNKIKDHYHKYLTGKKGDW